MTRNLNEGRPVVAAFVDRFVPVRTAGNLLVYRRVNTNHSSRALRHGSWEIGHSHYKDDWTKWSGTYSDVLNNGCRAAVAWNVATDEHGKPNIGPYPCEGIVIINAHTQEVIRSGQYWALAHFSRSIKRGPRRIESQSEAPGLSHVAVENPGGEKVLILTNTGSARTIQVNQGLRSATVPMKENSIATVMWT